MPSAKNVIPNPKVMMATKVGKPGTGDPKIEVFTTMYSTKIKLPDAKTIPVRVIIFKGTEENPKNESIAKLTLFRNVHLDFPRNLFSSEYSNVADLKPGQSNSMKILPSYSLFFLKN